MPKRKLSSSMHHLLLAVFLFLSGGALIFSVLEDWSFIDSFYFVTMTATTVGYGDFAPTHTVSKMITILYSLVIIPFILYAFNFIAKYEVDRVDRQIRGIRVKQQLQESEIVKAERKIKEQKRLIKEQQENLERQDKKLRRQEKINREQEIELQGQHKKITKAQREIKEHDEELEVVEDFVEKKMRKEIKKH